MTTVIVEGITTDRAERSISEWVKQATIDVAMRALREEVDKGFDSEPVVITDGMPRRDPLLVRPFGKIEFAARPNMAEAVLWALTALQKASPVRSGRYASSHTIILNGVEITGNIQETLRGVKPSDRVQIVNFQPYARKLEGRPPRTRGRGKNKTRSKAVRGISKQAPNGIYRVVLRAVLNRFGRTLFLDFKYVKPNRGVTVGNGSTKRRAQVYPALNFFIKSSTA